MHALIRERLVRKLSNPVLDALGDGAIVSCGGKAAFSTDSFVVSPLEFPGADIGKLAVCGTVNDLVMMGANPEYLSLAFIIEEGLLFSVFDKTIDSIARAAKEAGVRVATGDLKVVEKGSADKLFINTSGIGRIIADRAPSLKNISSGDKVIVSGNIGQHGLAVMSRRKGLDFDFGIKSDCACLNGLLLPLWKAGSGIKFMRDPTRGGVATTLNEIALGCGLGIEINEGDIPVQPAARAACELLGFDPLYMACEGRAVIFAAAKDARGIVGKLRRHPLGRNAAVIGRVVRSPKAKVVLNTKFGTRRFVDMLSSDPLPRIC